MKYDLEILQEYINNGLVEKNDHPVHPLTIYNYTRECQYESRWDDITLNTRGLILDNDGNIIARGFSKFFNIEEVENIPNEEFEVFEKIDGSLGILFYYSGEWHLSTKGSFISKQAIEGFKMLQKYDYNKLHKGYTYLFEIVYKDNRIVCEYDFNDLVLIGMMDPSTGYEIDIHGDNENDIRFKNLIRNIGFRVVKKYDGVLDYRLIKGMIKEGDEGFVVRFKSGVRVKVKSDEYKRIHRLITEFSTIDIWKNLSIGGMDINKMLDRVPDEFDLWVRENIQKLKMQYLEKEEIAKGIIAEKIEGKDLSRKEIAEILRLETPINRALIFCMLDGMDYSDLIWKNIRPIYEKPTFVRFVG